MHMFMRRKIWRTMLRWTLPNKRKACTFDVEFLPTVFAGSLSEELSAQKRFRGKRRGFA